MCVSVFARVCALKALDYVWFKVIFFHAAASSSQVEPNYKCLTSRNEMSVVKLRADQLVKIFLQYKTVGISHGS